MSSISVQIAKQDLRRSRLSQKESASVKGPRHGPVILQVGAEGCGYAPDTIAAPMTAKPPKNRQVNPYDDDSSTRRL